MTTERIILIAVNIFATLVAIYACISAWKKRKEAGAPAKYLAIVMAAVAVYAGGYAGELASNTIPAILRWVKIEHIGIQLIGPNWLLLTLTMTGRQKMITPKKTASLYIIPAVLLVSVYAGWFHHNPRLTPNAPFPTFYYDYTFFSWLSIIYISLCLVISFIFFTIMVLKSPSAFRKQAAILLLGSIIPWAGMLIRVLGLSPYNLDLAPISISISGFIYLLGFRRFQILDIVPMARDIIFDNMGDGVLVVDIRDHIVDFNPTLRKLFPQELQNAIGHPYQEVFCSYPHFIQLLDGKSIDTVEIKVRSNQENLYYRCMLQPIIDAQKNHVGNIITFHDYTEVRELIKQLSDLATMDNLTGIYNRRYFYELAKKELSRAVRYRKPLSVILFDIDHFKDINDTNGHSAGDAMLKIIVKTFIKRLRKSDIMGRFGGDEFLILLPETEIGTASRLAEELRSLLENTQIHYENQHSTITASFGVTSTDHREELLIEDLIRIVDQAMYQAKQNGRNCVQASSHGNPSH